MAAPRRVALTEWLALAALGSLFIRSDRYPQLLEIGDISVRIQDLGFVALAICAGRRVWRGCRPRTLAALALGLAVLLGVSVARSPGPGDALVSVIKLAEFVLAGMVIVLVLRGAGREAQVTGVLTLGITANALVGLVRLLDPDGLSGILHARTSTLLGTETAATAAAAVSIWCAARLASRQRVEVWPLAFGVAGSAWTLVAAKSALTPALIPAAAVLLASVDRRWFGRGIVVLGLLVVAVGIGRSGDLKRLVSGERTTPPPAVAAHGPPIPPAYEHQAGSFVHRVALGYAGLHAAADHPVLGRGWLSTPRPAVIESEPYDRLMAERFPRLDPALFLSDFPTHFHNAYLQLGAEAGLLALLLFVAVLGVAISRSLRRLDRSDAWILAGLGWLVLMAFHYLGNALFGGSISAVVVGMGLATVAVGPFPRPSRSHAARMLVTIAGLGVVLVLALELGGGGAAVPTERVVLAVHGREHERGPRARVPVGWSVGNGYTELSARGGAVSITALTEAGRPAGPVVPLLAGGRPLDPDAATVVQRTSRVTTLRFAAAGGERVAVSMVLGVPGVYLSAAPRELELGVRLPGDALYLLDRDALSVERDPGHAARRLPALEPIAAVDFSSRVLAVALSDDRSDALAGLQLRPEQGEHTVFLGLTPVEDAAFGSSDRGAIQLASGQYLRLARGGRAQVRRAGATTLGIAAMPLDIASPAILGVDELAAVGVANRVHGTRAACLLYSPRKRRCP